MIGMECQIEPSSPTPVISIQPCTLITIEVWKRDLSPLCASIHILVSSLFSSNIRFLLEPSLSCRWRDQRPAASMRENYPPEGGTTNSQSVLHTAIFITPGNYPPEGGTPNRPLSH